MTVLHIKQNLTYILNVDCGHMCETFIMTAYAEVLAAGREIRLPMPAPRL